MSSNLKILVTLTFAISFCYLFTHESAGLNVFLLNLITIPFMFLLTRTTGRSILFKIAVICAAATAISTLLYGYWWPVMINIISLAVMAGAAAIPQLKTVFVPLLHSTTGILLAQAAFVNEFGNVGRGRFRGARMLNFFRIGVLPVFIVFIFLGLYSSANPDLNTIVAKASLSFEKFFNYVFAFMDAETVMWLVIGLICGNILFLSKADQTAGALESNQDEKVTRKRSTKRKFKFPALRREFRMGFLMLLLLNLLLLFMNILDIRLVWFGFEWSGQYLKQFVHEGTWLLIISIAISMLIILWYFRKNLNFFSRSKWLRWMAYAWIVQNAILAVSVAIRNFHYIEYYALAFKRIGVLIFLALVLFGLYTIYIKLKQKRSFFYLVRVNGLAILVALSASTLPDWDNIIAKYNLSHYTKAFVHFDFLAELDDRALVNLDLSDQELKVIEFWQKTKKETENTIDLDESMPGSWSRDYYMYMSPDIFKEIIQKRKKHFVADYEQRGWLSWNWAEWRTYNKLLRSNLTRQH